MSKIVVAVDGPAGSGKSSVSKQAAKELGFGYLDTGAGYRALTLVCIKLGIPFEEIGAKDLVNIFKYSISLDPENYWVKVGDEDFTQGIRAKEVELGVSKVASQPAVRSHMREITRSLVTSCDFPGVIVEGRDITSVVLPDAETRVLLTATEEVRLQRRAADLSESTFLTQQLTERDRKDSKVVDFVNPAPGVTLIDTSSLSFEQSVAALIAEIRKG